MDTPEESELTPLQEHERAAMCGDRAAVARVVTAVRHQRAVLRRLIAELRFECTNKNRLEQEVEGIEAADAATNEQDAYLAQIGKSDREWQCPPSA